MNAWADEPDKKKAVANTYKIMADVRESGDVIRIEFLEFYISIKAFLPGAKFLKWNKDDREMKEIAYEVTRKMTQLHLFPTILRMIELEAESPKKAFYRLMIEETMGIWAVVKESGAAGKVLDRRRWVMESAEKAVQWYERILRDKLNPNRGSPRKYRKRRPGEDRLRCNDGITIDPSDNIKAEKTG